MRFWIVRPRVGCKVGLMYASDICGWSIRLGLGKRVLCFGHREVPAIKGALPEKHEGEPIMILGA